MPKVDPAKLDELLEAADVGERTRKKLMKANADVSPNAPPAGHGCAAPAADPAKF